jgi:cyanophycinase-like exopeptidase
MPEPPDFEQIAREPVEELRKYFMDDGPDREARQNELLGQVLRQVWNARGAADIATLEAEWREGINRAPMIRALRTLDR